MSEVTFDFETFKEETRALELDERVLEELEKAETPVSVDDLAARVGLPRERYRRRIRLIVADLVADGVPIVASRRGFWIARQGDEVANYVDHLQRLRDGLDRHITDLQRAWGGANDAIHQTGRP